MELRWKIGETWYSNQGQDKHADEQKIPNNRTTGDHLDEIISKYEQKGGFADLEGKGKPLEIPFNPSDAYLFNKMLKNANVMPPWLELQHEIRDLIGILLSSMKENQSINIPADLKGINKKIKLYNSKCPIPSLQKPLLTQDTIELQYAKWL